jgi:DNA integrity scanning protein DisA with diadenylate cyclase activity
MTAKKEEPKPKKEEAKPKTAPAVEAKDKPPASKTDSSRTFLSEGLAIARRLNVDRVIYVCTEAAPLDVLNKGALKKKIIIASASDKLGIQAEEMGLMHEQIPAYAFDRFEKIKIALGACTSSGKATDGMQVLCLVGEHNSKDIDTCMAMRAGHHSEEQAALSGLLADTEQSAQVLEAVLNIALSVGFEGIEGTPIGTIFMVGDSTAVMEKSKQLTLNPFQGYSEEERNILDPKIRDAVKNFCLLDGAIIIREDGVLLAAGRYLRTPEDLELELPLGLGTRNAAAMGISKVTKAISFVISKSTGSVRIYKGGKLTLELKQPRRRT